MYLNKILKKFFHFYKIIKHNQKKFVKKSINSDNQILIEFNNFCSSHIALSYCANILKKKYNANIIGYTGHVLLSFPLKRGIISKINYFFGKNLGLNFFGVYKSFGTKKFIFPEANDKILKLALKSFQKFKNKVKNLKDLENFKIKKVHVGDLLYDTYLKNNYNLEPTIDLESKKFLDFVYDFLILFEHWDNYFKTNKVKAIISSHAVYVMGLILRIGQKYKSKSYVLTHDQLWQINKKQPRQFYEVNNFRKIFRKLNKPFKKNLLDNSKRKIKTRLDGKYTSDYGYITKSPYGYGNKLNLKKKNKNIFVIANHDFVDAPHAIGNSIFPDFYQWFIKLCEFSLKTNDIWLVKNHPDFGEEYSQYVKYERDVTKHALKNFPNIKLLDKKTTLNDLLNINVDAVFTVNGTIGFDFAILGIPVINASLNNPHINYDFNYHPRNEKQLKNIIFNFKKIKLKLIKKIYMNITQ